MSTLPFTPLEIRLATLGLASVAAMLPLLYTFWPSRSQSSTQHIKTFNKLIQSYSKLRPQALTTNASRDFSHTILPASLDSPSRSLQPFQQHATQIFSLFTSFEMLPRSNGIGDAVHFCPKTNTVIAHCSMGGKINVESEMGKKLGLEEWWTECVLFVRMNADGKRIVEVREFVDSAKAEELKGKLSAVFE